MTKEMRKELEQASFKKVIEGVTKLKGCEPTAKEAMGLEHSVRESLNQMSEDEMMGLYGKLIGEPKQEEPKKEDPKPKPELKAEVEPEEGTFERIKDKITFRMVNTRKNQERLNHVVHWSFMDLSAYYVVEAARDENGFVLTSDVLPSDLKTWGMTKEELWEIAVANTQRIYPATITSIDHMTQDFLSDSKESGTDLWDEDLADKEDMKTCRSFTLTNKREFGGASTMLYPKAVLRIRECIGEDFYILPTSTREVMIFPLSRVSDPRVLKSMIIRGNRDTNVVPRNEVLSDSVYRYTHETRKITRVY